MNKVGRIGVVALLCAAVSSFGLAPAGALAPAKVAGTYSVEVNWNGEGFVKFPMTLLKNHTGSEPNGAEITWSSDGRNLTIIDQHDGPPVTTALARKTKAGLNNARHPGTCTTTEGDTGVWYAVRTA